MMEALRFNIEEWLGPTPFVHKKLKDGIRQICHGTSKEQDRCDLLGNETKEIQRDKEQENKRNKTRETRGKNKLNSV